MDEMRRSELARSKMFVSAVLDATASCLPDCHDQQQMKSKAVSDAGRFPKPYRLKDDDAISISSGSSVNSSSTTAASCKSSSSTLCPAIKAPFPVAYFKLLVEDAADRLEEASKFYKGTVSYSFMLEFHVKILSDLHEELGNPPQHMEFVDYDNLSQLRRRLRQLQMNLVERRFLFLQSRNSKISSPEGAEPYLKAAAEAKAARRRQCQMVILIEQIAKLGRQEEEYRQRRLKAEAELLRYVSELVQPSDDSGVPKYDKLDPADGTTPGNSEDDAAFSYDSKNWSTYPIPKKPTKNCIFCKEFHWSHLCLVVPTLERRIQLFEQFGLCLLCGKRQHSGTCSYSDIWCKWPQCGQKNQHNTTLCPNIPYPIDRRIVQVYRDHVDYVWKLRSESPVSSFHDTSQCNQRKDRKRNRKLSSNAKTLTFGCHSKMVT